MRRIATIALFGISLLGGAVTPDNPHFTASGDGTLSYAGASACNFVSYEDAQSIAEKGALVRAQGLGGTIIWTIGQGHLANQPVGQRDPLLDAVRAAFLQ